MKTIVYVYFVGNCAEPNSTVDFHNGIITIILNCWGEGDDTIEVFDTFGECLDTFYTKPSGFVYRDISGGWSKQGATILRHYGVDIESQPTWSNIPSQVVNKYQDVPENLNNEHLYGE